MIYFLSKTLLSWSFILPSLFLAGYQFRSLVDIKNEVLRGIFFYAIGMAIFSYLIIGLSAAHVLNPGFIWAVLILFFLSQIRVFPVWVKWVKHVFWDFMTVRSLFEKINRLVFISGFFALLAGSLSPELGGDALCYQLNLPKIFLATGSVNPIYYDVNSYFPLLMNHLYLIGLATGGILSAKLFHFLTGILLFLALKSQIHEEIGCFHSSLRATEGSEAISEQDCFVAKSAPRNDGVGSSLAYFLALVLLLTPVIYNMLSTTYVDVGLGLYIFLALIALRYAARSSKLKLFFLSGFFLGCAVSIKYLGLISALALGCVFIYESFVQNLAHKIKTFLVWVSGFGLAFGYWIIRNWYLTGNPLYPYLSSVFKTEPIPGMKYDQVGMGYSLIHLITVFWNMMVHPTAFGTFSDRIGIFYILLLPCALIAAIFVPQSRSYVLFAVVFIGIWFYVCQAGRYLIPAMPPVILAAGMGLHYVSHRIQSFLKSFVSIGGLVILVTYLFSGVAHYRYSFLLLTGQWSWQEYLLKLERTTLAANWINEHLPPNVKILLAWEPRQFYFNRPLVRDVALRYRSHYDRKNLSVASFSDFLKQEHITHILMSDRVEKKEYSFDPNNLLAELITSEHVKPIQEMVSKNIRDGQFNYRLYELK